MAWHGVAWIAYLVALSFIHLEGPALSYSQSVARFYLPVKGTPSLVRSFGPGVTIIWLVLEFGMVAPLFGKVLWVHTHTHSFGSLYIVYLQTSCI